VVSRLALRWAAKRPHRILSEPGEGQVESSRLP